MAADQSIIDNIVLCRKIALAVGGAVIDESTTDDLSGLLVMNSYVCEIVLAFGDTPIDNTGLDTELKATGAIATNFGKIAKAVT